MKEVVLKPGDLSETIRKPNGNDVSRPTGNMHNKTLKLFVFSNDV
jgi:hypothetical protein